ncbi:hypothetical protein [Methanocaldococcus sp.]
MSRKVYYPVKIYEEVLESYELIIKNGWNLSKIIEKGLEKIIKNGFRDYLPITKKTGKRTTIYIRKELLEKIPHGHRNYWLNVAILKGLEEHLKDEY